jgi:hypothetical protein
MEKSPVMLTTAAANEEELPSLTETLSLIAQDPQSVMVKLTPS